LQVNNYFRIKSGNLVKCYGITKLPGSNDYVMVMNYCEEGNLRDYLKSHRSQISLKDKIYFIYRICFALHRIHSKNLIHRDLHSGNILLFAKRCLIADLGLCGPDENKLTDIVYGILPYVAPELISEKWKRYSKAADIYSLGMLMWEIFAEYPPFNNRPHNGDLAIEIVGGERPPMLSEIPDTFKGLIKRCWEKDTMKRPEMEEIYEIVNKEYINVYENGELMSKYENKSIIEVHSLKIQNSYSNNTSGMLPIEDVKSLILDSRFNKFTGNYCHFNYIFTNN